MFNHFFMLFLRFCTVMLTVFGKNQRMAPVVIFKCKGNISVIERQQYSKGVHVIFTPCAVINGPSMDVYVQKWLEKVQKHYLIRESVHIL